MTSLIVEMFAGRENTDVLNNDISGAAMTRLIKEPAGCGEENMIHMSHTVIATTYLDKTNQWDVSEIERRNDALQHIRTGGLTQMHFSTDTRNVVQSPLSKI